MSSSFVTTYRDRDKPRRIYVFRVDADGRLRVKRWTGTRWSEWVDHGSPGPPLEGLVGVITYFDGKRRIYAFCREALYQQPPPLQHVYLRYWDGTEWKWADQGNPPASWPMHGPSVISYPEGGQQRIYSFVTGGPFPNLYVRYWDGTEWKWNDQGKPPGLDSNDSSVPEAITYRKAGTQRISCFVVGEDSHLYRNSWNGTQWKWVDQGHPAGTALAEGSNQRPGAIAYVAGGTARIFVFVVGENGHLYRKRFNGTMWQWFDHGKPVGTTVLGDPVVITYSRPETGRRFYAFVRGSDDHLHVNFWDGTQWKWKDQGTPPDTVVGGRLGAVTYLDGGTQRIYVFSGGLNGHVIFNYWNGTQWKWADLGQP